MVAIYIKLYMCCGQSVAYTLLPNFIYLRAALDIYYGTRQTPKCVNYCAVMNYYNAQNCLYTQIVLSAVIKATMNCVHTTSINPILINTKSQYLQLREFGLYLPPHLLMSYDMKQKYERPLYQLNITTR